MENNQHATTIIVGTNGILITGSSASGKTSLASELLDDATRRNEYSALVADDQTLVSNINGRLIARAPETLVNRIEIRGFGIGEISACPSAVLHLVVEIIEPDKIIRLPEAELTSICQVKLPIVRVPRHRYPESIRIVMAATERQDRQGLDRH